MGWRLNLYVAEVELVARDWPCDHWPLFSNVGGPLVSQRMMYILYCQLWSLMGCFRAGWVLCSSQLIFLPQLTLLFSHTPLFNLALKLERNLSGLRVWLYTAVACKLTVFLGVQHIFPAPSHGVQGLAKLCIFLWNNFPFSQVSLTSHSSTFLRLVPLSWRPFSPLDPPSPFYCSHLWVIIVPLVNPFVLWRTK